MAIAQSASPRFEIGRVLERVFSVVGKNFFTFALLSLIPGVPLAFMHWRTSGLPEGPELFEALDGGILTALGLAGLVYLIAAYVLQAGVVHGTVSYLNGRQASFGDCISTGLKNFGPLILITLLYVLGVIAGFILLFVPGIIIATAWIMAVPTRVVEHTGPVASLGRSRQLTKGHRWAIFGLLLVFGILSAIVGAIVGGVVAVTAVMSGGLGTAFEVVFSTIIQMISAIFGSALIASMYYELRFIKEGIGPEALASVFD